MDNLKKSEVVLPITMLNAEIAKAKVVDESHQGYAAENDTFNDASGDSDTI